jgi:hypothetical protein
MRGITTRFTGLLLVALGIWGGLVPFVGHYFHFSLGPDKAWTWTSGRLYLDVLPAVVTVLGGLILMDAGPRGSARVGALLALAGGLWFAIGPGISQLWHAGGVQGAGHGSAHIQMLEMLTYHTGLGAVITALAGYAFPRFPVRDEVVAPGRGRVAAAGAAAGAGGAVAAGRGDRWYHEPGALDMPASQREQEAAREGEAPADAEPRTAAREPAPIDEPGREEPAGDREPVGSHEPVGDHEPVGGREPAGEAGPAEEPASTSGATASGATTQTATATDAPAQTTGAGNGNATTGPSTSGRRRSGGLLGGLLRR